MMTIIIEKLFKCLIISLAIIGSFFLGMVIHLLFTIY